MTTRFIIFSLFIEMLKLSYLKKLLVSKFITQLILILFKKRLWKAQVQQREGINIKFRIFRIGLRFNNSN